MRVGNALERHDSVADRGSGQGAALDDHRRGLGVGRGALQTGDQDSHGQRQQAPPEGGDPEASSAGTYSQVYHYHRVSPS